MRVEGDFITINKNLLPLSWFYGLGVGVRNLLFEMGVLKSRSFDIPVISVGNITVGGTGKTPHVEYLIRLLKEKMNVAVLSRGYKRKSSGFVLSDKDTPMRMIGDEPYQIKQKFPDITVAVDKKRTRGIDKLTEEGNGLDLDVILLDDAFQHRYVKPGINILLVDYHRLLIYDRLLPAGRLREPIRAKDRADIVIVTKCPKDLNPMEFRVITKAMKLYPYQQLFFSSHDYDSPKGVFTGKVFDGNLSGKNIMLLTGIASPEQLMHDLQELESQITPLTFGDHHNFSKKDVANINKTFASMAEPKVILTTEKDATRLETASWLKERMTTSPKTAIVLGTGLGQLASEITDRLEFPYKDIPNFPVSTVEGHSGKLIFGKLGGVDIMAMQGRFHFYEGYSMKDVTFPVRVMYELGIETLFVSNAAGGMNPDFKIGDLMIITDHINFFPEHPLRGKNFPTGPRFPDMHETYDHNLIAEANAIAKEKGINVKHGVYVGVQGPTFETPAEYKMYRILGGDAVGMSTVPEVIVAHHCGIKTFGVSVITDLGGFDVPVEVSHEEVQEAANMAQPLMTAIMREMIVRSESIKAHNKEQFNTDHPTEGWK